MCRKRLQLSRRLPPGVLLRPLLMIRRTSILRHTSHLGLRRTFHATLLAAASVALAAAPQAYAQTAATPASRNAAAAAPESPYHGAVIEDIVARVNDQVISTSDFNRADQDLEAQAKQRNWTQSEMDDQKRQLLRDLIDNQLLLSKGKQLGITGEAETVRQLDELRKQNHLDSMEALEKAAEQQGVNFADFKASIQNRIITSQVIRDEVGRRLNITQADEQQYYDEHKDQFVTPEQVKLSEILIPTADPDNTAEVAKAQTKADAVEADLKGGKDFAAEAKADSGNSTAAQGGLLGDYKRGQLAKVLEDATFSLKPGEFTAPIRTKQGFVILKVESHQQGGEQPFASVQPQVEDAVGMAKMQPALRQYLTRLREEAYVDVKPGYYDAGSSKDETRPIFSAYQPPQPKKKKKALARTRFSGRGRTRNNVVAAQRGNPTPTAPSSAASVPSLADVASVKAAAAPPASSSKPTQTASAKTMKPGKREKVRFGQAPRETLPAAATREEDAGASAANGNGSTAETADAAAGGQNVPAGAHYENGESAGEVQVAAKKVKTRFSQHGVEHKAAKVEKKRNAKIDPYPNPVADTQEVADKKVQSQPLGLAGDTSKKPLKPKPTEKTRYSDEAGKKTAVDANGSPTGSSTAPPSGTPPAATPSSQQSSPQSSPQSSQEPSSEPATGTGTGAPVQTQNTPAGTGDPLGNPTPAPTQPQQPQ